MVTPLRLTRAQILARRRQVQALDERLAGGAGSLRRAAWAGQQDSVPRSALLALHARVAGVTPATWEDPALVQVWGPRFAAYVVPAADVAVFTRGRLPTGGARRRRAEDLAARLETALAGERLRYGDAGRLLGVDPNELRYAAATGTVLLRWEGARQPVIWTVPPPDVVDDHARLELCRRFLHVLGPATSEAFARWAGVRPSAGVAALEGLGSEVVPVRTPVGDAWLLASDEEAARADPEPAAPARLLPSGDAAYLAWSVDRDLLVPRPAHRDLLWTSRVWPGALLVDGDLAGTWRRTRHAVTVQPWRRLPRAAIAAVEDEATSLPLPDLDRDVTVTWEA